MRTTFITFTVLDLYMSIRELNSKVATALRGPLSREFKIMLGLATILLVANIVYTSYMLGFTNGRAFTGDTFTVSGDDSFLILLRIGITIGLLVCAAGLAFRRLFGVIASMLGVIWLVVMYGWWQRKSVAFLRNAEVSDYSRLDLPNLSHAAGLWTATSWDILVLAIGAILFIWQAIVLIRVAKAGVSYGVLNRR
ncbi:MAG: hypothetical protein ACREBG_04760 [Pyrinomonadaceae bacterium]